MLAVSTRLDLTVLYSRWFAVYWLVAVSHTYMLLLLILSVFVELAYCCWICQGKFDPKMGIITGLPWGSMLLLSFIQLKIKYIHTVTGTQ